MNDSIAAELVRQLVRGEITATEVVEAQLARIERQDDTVKAFLRVDSAAALARAEEIDSRRKRGWPVGRLAGLPVAVKDNLCSQGELTTCGSRMLEDFRSPYDATVVARLKAADAVLLGRTNLDEFAMGGSNENSAFFPTHNPWDLSRVPGGSSGGSAAAVASGMAPAALGSDTGGSIRCPAALCGVSGLKPSYGRVSRHGLVAFASSLDQVGPMGRTAEDCALLLEVVAGRDPLDATTVDRATPQYAETIDKPLENPRIGLVAEHFGEGLDPEVEAAVREAARVYESLGAKVTTVSLPHAKYAVATYYVIASCEASSNLARFDGARYGLRANDAADLSEMYRRSRSEGLGEEAKRRIMLGAYALSAGYHDAYSLKASKVRRLIQEDFTKAFAEVDVIAGPVTPTPAFKLGERIADPLAMYLFDLYTVEANLAGIPGMSIPCGFSATGLPIGLHLQAPAFEEERLLRAASMFQRATSWHRRRPAMSRGDQRNSIDANFNGAPQRGQ